MEYLHELKDLLCAELEEYAEKGKMSMGDLETIHKLTDTVKNILKIKMLGEDGGYSEDEGSSYARGRGRYAKRDSRGRYSRDGGYSSDGSSYRRGGYSRDDGKQYMMEQLEEMMDEAEKPAERDILRRCMDALKKA